MKSADKYGQCPTASRGTGLSCRHHGTLHLATRRSLLAGWQSLGLGLVLMLTAPLLAAHSPPAGLAADDPLAADLRFCDAVVAVALQALSDRDRERPLRLVADDVNGAGLKNEVARHVHAEPQIRSQKFAMAYARGRCSEWLHAGRSGVQ